MSQNIYKVGGILIQNKRILLTRAKNKEFFIAPGGKLEQNESKAACLIRELKEELSIEVKESNLEFFGTFTAHAAGKEDITLHMDVFIVKKWESKLVPSNEVEEVLWYDSSLANSYKLGSIFEHEVIPRLKEGGLID